MNIFLRAILVTMGAIVTALVAWVATPSSLFFNPFSLTLDGENLTLVRDTPFGEVSIHWAGEITLLDQDNFECGGQGYRVAQVIESGVLTSKIGAWSRPCLDAGAPFILRYSYQVLFLGLIPLRPTGISIKIEGDNLQCLSGQNKVTFLLGILSMETQKDELVAFLLGNGRQLILC